MNNDPIQRNWLLLFAGWLVATAASFGSLFSARSWGWFLACCAGINPSAPGESPSPSGGVVHRAGLPPPAPLATRRAALATW